MKAPLLLLLTILFGVIFPSNAQVKSKIEQKYHISACDWMMLKRQKIGSFQLMRELGGDGVEIDMGSLGDRDTFDSKLHQPYFQKLFIETSIKNNIKVSSVAMSGFYGQSFLKHSNYKSLVEDCLNTLEILGAKVAFLPLGGIKENWMNSGEARSELVRRLHEVGEIAADRNLIIGIRTNQEAKEDIRLLKEIDSEGIKIYFNFQDALDNNRDLCKELKRLGKKRICQIHCTDTDGVTLPNNKRLNLIDVKKTLDKMEWSGWLVIERSRNKDEISNVKKNFGTNVIYLKRIFQ